jgi:hypothetical protein
MASTRLRRPSTPLVRTPVLCSPTLKAMDGGFWWSDSPRERVYMEVTQRDDMGGDLLAPLVARGGRPTASYALVPHVRAGEVVIHYASVEESIVGVSVATSDPEPTTLYWVARGASARLAGAEPEWLAGVRVPLDHFRALDPPLSLDDLRAQERAVMGIRASLQLLYGPKTPLYFPWVPYRGQPMRTFQSYLVKVPQDVIDLFPALRKAVDEVTAATIGPFQATPEVEAAEAALTDTASRDATRKGQGYQLDQKVKVAVEAHAMNIATEYFAVAWEVEDVHGSQSYDLVCTKGGREKRIEVKGTTTDGSEILLTPNEVKHARTYRDVALFVLADVVVEREPDGSVVAGGGTPIVHDPWDISAGKLKPVGYRFELP